MVSLPVCGFRRWGRGQAASSALQIETRDCTAHRGGPSCCPHSSAAQLRWPSPLAALWVVSWFPQEAACCPPARSSRGTESRDSQCTRHLMGHLTSPSMLWGQDPASCGPPPGFVYKVLSAHSHSCCFCARTTELRGCDTYHVAHKPETSTLWLSPESLPHSRSPCVGLGGQEGLRRTCLCAMGAVLEVIGLREGASCPMGVRGWETEPGWVLTSPSPPSDPGVIQRERQGRDLGEEAPPRPGGQEQQMCVHKCACA